MVTLGRSTDANPPRQLDRSESVHGDRRRATDRIRTAGVHGDGVLSMIEHYGRYHDVTKQQIAVQGLIESTSREVSRHHLESPACDACGDGCGDRVADELLEALDADRHVLRVAR